MISYFTERRALESIKEGTLKIKEEPSKILSGNKFQDRYCVLRDGYLFLYKDMKVFVHVVFAYIHVCVGINVLVDLSQPCSWKSRPAANEMKWLVSWGSRSASGIWHWCIQEHSKELRICPFCAPHVFFRAENDISPKEKSNMLRKLAYQSASQSVRWRECLMP